MPFFALIGLTLALAPRASANEFRQLVFPLLQEFCIDCHSDQDASGNVNFDDMTDDQVLEAEYETLASAVENLRNGTMPPEDERQPSPAQRKLIYEWYDGFLAAVKARPSISRPRRLSVTEYRNTLKSVVGFDLEVDVIEAEQTVSERSMVVKLLPTDPPGKSGFKNDTHQNPLSTLIWDRYTYLTEVAIEELFSSLRETELREFSDSIRHDRVTGDQAFQLALEFTRRAFRRPVASEDAELIRNQLANRNGTGLVRELKRYLKATLMSPRFMYVGLMTEGRPGAQRRLSPFEFAERLSYFLWADMPDERLLTLAEEGTLLEPSVYEAEVDRMLRSEKARSLAEVFAVQWLTLDEIDHVSDNPPKMVALKSQPIDFLHYLFTQERPVLELIDSQTTFINPHTARMYRGDAGQMTKYVKRRGIEVEIVTNQRVRLNQTPERGGILTMPGVLAMNRGPILRGTWMLERILGQELPDPPANVGQVPPNRNGSNLTFRQRFEQHRANAACASCHDKIDPLGFALQSYGDDGQYLLSKDPPIKKGKRKGNPEEVDFDRIDTAGQLPTGETFDDIDGLKQILLTDQREVVVRNIVQRALSYALCRKLELHDRPVVDDIVRQVCDGPGSWHDLWHAVIDSVLFQEVIVPESAAS